MENADQALFIWLNGLAGGFALFDSVVGWVASDHLVPVSLSLTLVVLWFTGVDKEAREKHQIGLMLALISLALSSLVVLIINAFYERPRPFEVMDVTLLFYRPTDPSFPANSAAAAFALAAAIWLVNRRVGTAMIVAAVGYGLSRIIAGVHYPLDVLAGWFIAVLVTLAVFRLKELVMPVLRAFLRLARIFCLA
ncbi:MAG: phosphatase PAP2 family protein [Chloroflexi bacterium]|nr:phosphatase PAP2 family protein [Chloroflexota bacterium]MDA1226786.1 phosphatase PAP2 family protein [Chloroflexota bacterium]